MRRWMRRFWACGSVDSVRAEIWRLPRVAQGVAVACASAASVPQGRCGAVYAVCQCSNFELSEAALLMSDDPFICVSIESLQHVAVREHDRQRLHPTQHKRCSLRAIGNDVCI